MDPVTPLFVHRVALTTVNAGEAAAPVLFPAVAVWTDLAGLWEAGLPQPESDAVMPLLVITDAVLDAANPAMVNVVIRIAEDETAEDANTGAPEPGRPHWMVRIPTAWLGLATAVMSSPLQFRIVLVDGQPPFSPEESALSPAEVAAVLMPAPEVTQEPLSMVMGIEWTIPLPFGSFADIGTEHSCAPPDLMRDQVWVAATGVALGHERALNRTANLAEWSARLAATSDSGSGPVQMAGAEGALTVDTGGNPGSEQGLGQGSGAEAARLASLTRSVETLAARSGSVRLPRTSTGAVDWPGPMADLAALLNVAEASPVTQALDALDRGATFASCVATYGFAAALQALVVVAAARAHVVCASQEGSRVTVTYVLGEWLSDAEEDAPWWTAQATYPLLLHHDIDVLVDLLGPSPVLDPSAGPNQLLVRYLHVLTEVLVVMDDDEDDFADRFTELDLVPPNLPDVVYLCTRLLDLCDEVMEDAKEVCPGCESVERLLNETEDRYRLVAAVAAALPLLADLDADHAGLAVGEEDWLHHRQHFLGHWLSHTVAMSE